MFQLIGFENSMKCNAKIKTNALRSKQHSKNSWDQRRKHEQYDTGFGNKLVVLVMMILDAISISDTTVLILHVVVIET